MRTDAKFWWLVDQMIIRHELVIDRPQHSAHPRYPDKLYPLDYGYLQGTTSGDGQGIDVWIGSENNQCVTGIICTVDLLKNDMEIKILLDCNAKDIQAIIMFADAGSIAMQVIEREEN